MLLFNRRKSYVRENIIKFKYISCYYLTTPLLGRFVLIFKFKYISCYYLTNAVHVFVIIFIIQIHLMLLFNRN